MTNGKLVRLRPAEAADARAIYDMGKADARDARLGGPLPITESDAQAIVACSARKESGYLLIVERVDDGGVVGFARIESLRYAIGSASVWLYIRPEARGNGYGSEALTMLRDAMFDEHNLCRIQVGVAAKSATARWLKDRGFEREVVRREALYVGGRYVDDWVYACLR